MKHYTLEQQRFALETIKLTWTRLVTRVCLQSMMRLPAFELGTSKDWGRWAPATRTFTINMRLAVEFAGHADFVDTVAHELAHQWVSEVVGGYESPHGPLWKRGARMFGADPRATAKDQLEALCTGLSPDDARVAGKVKKLLALAGSSNENEAELAALRARELMCRHKLDASHGEPRWGYKTLGEPWKRRPRWLYIISNILKNFYDVETLWLSEFDFEYDREVHGGRTVAKVLEVTGTPAAVAVAEYVYDFLIREGERRLEDYRRKGGRTSMTARTNFLLGLHDGFRSKLQEQTEALERDPEQTALVLVKDPKLSEFFHARYPRIHFVTQSSRIKQDEAARSEGRRQGREMTILEAVSSNGDGPVRALPHLR